MPVSRGTSPASPRRPTGASLRRGRPAALRFQPGAVPQRDGRLALAPAPSSSAARCQRLCVADGPGSGAVSAMNCWIAAAIAAASWGEAAGVTSSMRGRGGRRSPLRAMPTRYLAAIWGRHLR